MQGKVTSNGKRGGNLKGKPHYDKNGKPAGGIKAVVTDSGKVVELEHGEVIINKEASRKHWRELSRINQSAGGGVPIGPPDGSPDEDPDTDKMQKGGKIDFNPNHIPSAYILGYAEKIKSKHPEIWKLGGNIFGNEAFENLRRVVKRGYWLDSEEWMYIKWRAYVARHKQDFRIEGVVAMLKWVDKVDKGWTYMKELISEKIAKKTHKKPQSQRMKRGGEVKKSEIKKGLKVEKEHQDTFKKLYKHRLTPEDAEMKIVQEHLDKNPKYYSKLKMIALLEHGGKVDDAPQNILKFLKKHTSQYRQVSTQDLIEARLRDLQAALKEAGDITMQGKIEKVCNEIKKAV